MSVRLLIKLLRILRELRAHERWTREQLHSHQAKALDRLRQYSYARSPFYQKFHQGLTGRPLAELPVLTKATVMGHFDDLVTDRSLHLDEVRAFAARGQAGQRYRDRYRVNATSGSSGQPGFFLFDENEWAHVLASFARGQEWSGLRIDLTHRQKMATVASISPWHMSSQVSATVKSWWRSSLRLPASQPLANTVEELNEWQPDVLISYASMAGILAGEQLADRLHIRPQMVYVASEILTAQSKKQITEAWGSPPYNQYAATETASIASEHRACRHLHFFEDLLITETVDEHDRPVPHGDYGAKILVTSLFGRTQPLIRYEINDSVRVDPEPHNCALPFAVLENIQGRVEDSLILPGTSGEEIVVRPLAINRIMDIAPVTGWQIVQQQDRGLVVLLRGARDGLTDQQLTDRLSRSLAQDGARAPYIRVEHVTEIPKTASGKSPLIKAYRPEPND